MSQEELAAQASLSITTIRYIEKASDHGRSARTERMLEGALGWASGSLDAIKGGGTATMLEGRREHDSGDFQRQLGYLTAVVNNAGDNGARLSDEAWEMLQARAMRDRRNVNAILMEALRVTDELFGRLLKLTPKR